MDEINATNNAEGKTAIEALTPWDRVLIARHQDRPRSLDYINAIFSDFMEIHGDRCFGDDHAMICGFGTYQGQRVAIVSQQKGKDTRDNIVRNWGMSHPEGYRKAMRVMKLAEKFQMPIIVLIDTPGAFPGIGAEERGQAEAIASNIRDMFLLRTRIICIVIGEGASGGALGIGVGDVVMMLENSWYCVISPEGCAAILWKDRKFAQTAADNLKLTPEDLLKLSVIDEIIKEPAGGAHCDCKMVFDNVSSAISKWLKTLSESTIEEILERRYSKFRKLGQYVERQRNS